jgi:hypothetical protein
LTHIAIITGIRDMPVAAYDPSQAGAVAGVALIFTILLWTFVAFIILLFVRKKRKFGVVWFWTNFVIMIAAFVVTRPGNTYFAWASVFLLIALIRLVLVLCRLAFRGIRKLFSESKER